MVVARKGDDRHDARRLPRPRRRRARCSPGCSRCSCSRRPACRSPAASSPSSRCSAPRSTSGQYSLALIGMLAAVIAAFVYLRIILTMYAPADDEDAPDRSAHPRRLRHRHRAHDRGRRDPLPRHHARRHARLRQATPPNSSPVRTMRAACEPRPAYSGGLAQLEAEAPAVFGQRLGLRELRDARAFALVERVGRELVRLRRSARARRRSRRGRARRAGGAARSTSTSGGTWRSSSSKRWLRACMKLVITTSSGERSTRSAGAPDTFSTKTRSTGPESACHSGTLLTTPPSTRRRPSWCTIGNTPGSAALASSAGLSGPAASTTSSPVSRSVAMTRSGISRSENERAGVVWWMTRLEALVPEQVRAAAHDVPRPVDLAAGEHVVGAELLPHRRELRDAGEVGRVSDGGAVERAGRGPDHDVGHDAALEQRPEHADLADALVAAAGQDERGARSRRARRRRPSRPSRPAGNGSLVPILRIIGQSRCGLLGVRA